MTDPCGCHPDPPPNVCEESAGWSCYADCDRDGQWTLFDFVCFQSKYIGGCP